MLSGKYLEKGEYVIFGRSAQRLWWQMLIFVVCQSIRQNPNGVPIVPYGSTPPSSRWTKWFGVLYHNRIHLGDASTLATHSRTSPPLRQYLSAIRHSHMLCLNPKGVIILPTGRDTLSHLVYTTHLQTTQTHRNRLPHPSLPILRKSSYFFFDG